MLSNNYESTENEGQAMSDISNDIIERAKGGDAQALEDIVRGIQDRVHQLARRMVYNPDIAQDMTQEILIRIVTKLSTFKGQSKFDTWVYRVATNYLLTARKAIAADPSLSFQMFSDDLLTNLADDSAKAPEDHIMINELRIKCTMAMLLCLDRDHRAAYILGEVLEFEQSEAVEILQISTANFRKRLSRARAQVQDYTATTCGLTNKAAPCSCPKRLPQAMVLGRVGESPSPDFLSAPNYNDVKTLATTVAANLRAAKMQRATGPLLSPIDFGQAVLNLVEVQH